jgi:predicted ArsR family transcriptional regulator
MPSGRYGQPMELDVLKALGDETRYALYRELATATSPRAVPELADALGLHPNTVRLHLERLREVGLNEVEAVHRGTVGRPSHRYSLAPGAPALGFSPPAHALLAGLLAAVVERLGGDAAAATATGRAWGAEAAKRRKERSCLHALGAELDALGFEPAADADPGPDGTTRIDFLHCPFRELAEAYPDLVCSLHRGICEGIADRAGKGTVTSFSSLYEPDPCHMTVAVP